jgi:hypothetical protein
MAFSLQDVMGIASLYLALVGLLGAFFSIQLGQWLIGIYGTEAKWQQIKDRKPKEQYFDRKLECYYQSVQSSSRSTLFLWVVVTAFLLIIVYFMEILRSSLNIEDSMTFFIYISIPCYIFTSIYLIVSLGMLFIGYSKSKSIRDESKGSL